MTHKLQERRVLGHQPNSWIGRCLLEQGYHTSSGNINVRSLRREALLALRQKRRGTADDSWESAERIARNAIYLLKKHNEGRRAKEIERALMERANKELERPEISAMDSLKLTRVIEEIETSHGIERKPSTQTQTSGSGALVLAHAVLGGC